MILQHIYRSSPPTESTVNDSVSVWHPYQDNGFLTRTASNSSLTTGRYGLETRATASFSTAINVTPAPGAVYECWLLVFGGTIPTTVSNTLFLAGTALTGNGLGVNTTTVRIRSSSTYPLSTGLAPQPYEAVFVKMQTGDFRIYQQGQKFTSTYAGGDDPITLGMGLAGSSLCLAARWTNETPDDALIWDLLQNPWQIVSPQTRHIPLNVAAGGNYTLTADVGTYTITGQSATLLRNKVFSADVGSYALTGQNATITYTPGAANYNIVANVGTYTVSGQSASLKRNKRLSADVGTYSLTGQNATISYSANSITLKAGSWLRYRIIP